MTAMTDEVVATSEEQMPETQVAQKPKLQMRLGFVAVHRVRNQPSPTGADQAEFRYELGSSIHKDPACVLNSMSPLDGSNIVDVVPILFNDNRVNLNPIFGDREAAIEAITRAGVMGQRLVELAGSYVEVASTFKLTPNQEQLALGCRRAEKIIPDEREGF